MATSTQVLRQKPVLAAGPDVSRRFKAIKGWALLGVAFLVVEVFAFTGWFTSGQFKQTPPGPTELPTWMKFTTRGWEVLGVLLAVASIYYFIYRPWRRNGRIGFDGLLVLACYTVVWQDTMANFFQPWLTYNAALVNHGSWDSQIPGWLSPFGHKITEPHVWVMSAFFWAFVPAAVAGCWLMRKMKQRWPNLGTLGLVGLLLGCFMIVDLVAEVGVWMPMGMFSYIGAPRGITLFHGHYWQFPVIEAVVMPGFWTACACLRYFRGDRGEIFVERGADDIRLSGKPRTGLRFLALTGFVNLAFLVIYSLPMAITGLYADSYPKDVTSRSYFLNGLCGPGTPYACPGPKVPIARRGSVRLGVDGSLVVPSTRER